MHYFCGAAVSRLRLLFTMQHLFAFFLLLGISVPAAAQLQMKGWELGGWVGTSLYLGDLNTDFRFDRPNLAGGVMGRYNFNHRIALRLGANYGRVRAFDSDSDNTFERIRNLSFRSDIFELTGQLEFNFLPYYHGSDEYWYTPYAFVGLAAFNYNPTTLTDAGDRVELRELGTEGQMRGEEYQTLATAIAYGIGIRWDLSYEWSMDVRLSLRNTSTDYLDDVSTTYPDLSDLSRSRGDVAAQLSDRSIVPTGQERVSREGTQRGDPNQNDHYLFLGIGLNYYFGDVLCPKISKRPRKKR